ncbi:mitochondrial carrier domain-containing protein [Lipomyces japonicus]|uniref:mitochondrial carrier domain-containing protein n=1 Tax=Lipomyces japonicus TaxID=56871 RepID=UPI0034CF37DF
MDSDSHPNPLRPYYNPPELTFHSGIPDLRSSSLSSQGLASFSNSNSSTGVRAESFLLDLDYADYLEFPNVAEVIRGVTNSVIMRYSSTFVAQPFEVAKMVIQVGKYDKSRRQFNRINSFSSTKKESGPSLRRGLIDDIDTFEQDSFDYDKDRADDDEVIDYFTTPGEELRTSNLARLHSRRLSEASTVDSEPGSSAHASRARRRSHAGSKINRRPGSPQSLQIGKHGPYITSAMGALWTKDGPWGIWRGTNVTFLQSVIFKSLETWLSALFSAVLSLPDASLVDIADSTQPILSLITSVTATTLATILISPLDIVRLKLILTPADAQPRSVVASLQCLPSLTCPSELLLPTTLLTAVTKLISRGTPYFLRARWGIERFSAPVLYNFLSFVSAVTELAIRLPLETVLRRGQIAYVGVAESAIVPTGSYNGILGTLWDIVAKEDNGSSGLEGLWRGWRIGMLGIVSNWGFGGLSQATNYSDREERF